jgi:flagellar motor switch protein FliN/FliY
MAQETSLPTPEELQNFSWLLDGWARGMVSAIEGMGCPAPAVQVGGEPKLVAPPVLNAAPAEPLVENAASGSESADLAPGDLAPGDLAPGHPAPKDPAAQGEIKGYWTQSFNLLAAACVWVGASPRIQKQIGGQALQAAGIDEPEENDSHDTYREILVQSMGGLAAQLTARCGREVTCLGGQSVPGEPHTTGISRVVNFRTEGTELVSMTFVASMEFIQQLVRDGFYRQSGWKAHDERSKDRLGETRSPREQKRGTAVAEAPEPVSIPFDSVLDMDIPVSISFGTAKLRLDEALKLKDGSIVSLGRMIDEPVELQVNGRMVARGEVVSVRGQYGIRILELSTRGERLGHIDPKHRPELETAGLS